MNNILQQNLTINTHADVLQCIGPGHPMAREQLHLLTLTPGQHLIGKYLVAVGPIPSDALRDILRYALYDRAGRIMLVRRRTEVKPTPSNDERDLAFNLADLCQALKVEIQDFLLVGSDSVYSWVDSGDLDKAIPF